MPKEDVDDRRGYGGTFRKALKVLVPGILINVVQTGRGGNSRKGVWTQQITEESGSSTF